MKRQCTMTFAWTLAVIYLSCIYAEKNQRPEGSKGKASETSSQGAPSETSSQSTASESSSPGTDSETEPTRSAADGKEVANDNCTDPGTDWSMEFSESSEKLTCDDFREEDLCDIKGEPNVNFYKKYRHLRLNTSSNEWAFHWSDFLTIVDRSKSTWGDIFQPSTPNYWCCGCGGGRCPPGTYRLPFYRGCEGCEAGKYSPGGTIFGCLQCSAGSYLNEGSKSECISCQAGKYADSEKATICVECPSGKESRSNSSTCKACAPGKYARTKGQAECTACPAGKNQSKKGSIACSQCSVGHFADAEGMANCTACGDGRASPSSWKTWQWLEGEREWSYLQGAENQSTCGCDKGLRLEDGKCIPCGEGTICEGNGEVKILKGFYSDLPLSVYHCFSDTLACPGGDPGESCAKGRRGISCAECEAFMKPSSEGRCDECKATDKAPAILACVSCFIILCVMYYIPATKQQIAQNNLVLAAMISCSQLVTFTQQVGVLGMLTIEFRDPIRAVLSVAQLLTFDIQLLSVGCISTFTPFSRFVFKMLFAIIGLATLILIHIVHVLTFHRGRFSHRMPVLISALGTTSLLVFISVVSTLLAPLQCSQHPNGKWTVRAYKDVTCWEDDDDHLLMVILAVSGLSLPIAFFAGIVYITWQLPQRVHNGDVEFLSTYGFLFFRFRPGYGWYINCVLARSFMIAVAPTLPNAIVQIICFDVCHQVSLIAAVHYKPWRMDIANFMDMACSSAILMVVNLASFYLTEEDFKLFSWVCTIAICLALLVGLAVLCRSLFRMILRRKKPYQFFLCHHKAKAGSFARLLKKALREHPKVSGDVFLDSDNLSQLHDLFHTVAHHIDTLLIIGTKDVFMRPWCAGEMTISRLKEINVVILAMPDWEPPDENVIENFGELVDMKPLTENHLTLKTVKATLQWIATLPVIRFPKQFGVSTLAGLAKKLTSGDKAGDILSSSTMHVGDSQVQVLVDDADMEAVAAAHFLVQLLLPQFMHCPQDVPVVLLASERAKGEFHTLIVICTNGCFEHRGFLENLVEAWSLAAKVLPVVVDSSFRFPSPEFLARMKEFPSPVAGKTGEELANIIAEIFHEIAAVFQPQHAADYILEANAHHIGNRVLSGTMSGVTTRAGGLDELGIVVNLSTDPHDPRASQSTLRSSFSTSKVLEVSQLSEGSGGGIDSESFRRRTYLV